MVHKTRGRPWSRKTNRLEIELPDPKKLAGVVRGPDGQPVAGLGVRIVGGFSTGNGGVKTDQDGKFETEWNPRGLEVPTVVSASWSATPSRNLAVAQDLARTRPAGFAARSALSIVGRVRMRGASR